MNSTAFRLVNNSTEKPQICVYATDFITVSTFMKEGSLSGFNSLRNRNLETQLISYRVRLPEALDPLGVIKIIITSNGNDTCLWVFRLNSLWQQTT